MSSFFAASTTETRPLKIYANLLKSASSSTSSKLELLDHIRLHQIRVPEVIVTQGTAVLNSGSSIGDRRFDIMEQVVIAALDTGKDQLADTYILKLRTKFPESARVKRLTGMSLEAKEKYNQAIKVYDDMLEANGANMIAMKRKVCVYKAQGQMKAAIRALTELLKIFQTDVESWKELCTLYMGKYSKRRCEQCSCNYR